MAVIDDATAATLHRFIADHVQAGSTVITDGWAGYLGIEAAGYVHDRRSQRAAVARGEDPDALLPGVHRIAALAKRWLLSTHQGAVDREHLPGYLNEFVFRFNRRASASRGLVFKRVLQLAVEHDPVRYRELIRRPRPRPMPPIPPGATGHPPSLERPRPDRPWRYSHLHNSGQVESPKAANPMPVLSAGWLIHAVVGMARILGSWVVANRSGCRLRAAARTTARSAAFAVAGP